MMKLPAGLRHISISTRISILLGLIILVTMGIFSAISLVRQQHDSIDALSRSTLLLGQTTEKILRLSMIKNRRADISAAIKDIVGNEGIRSVRILNHEGIIKFSSRRSELDQHISHTNPLCRNCHAGGDSTSMRPVSSFYTYHYDEKSGIIYSSLPIYNSPSCYNSDCHTGETGESAVAPIKAGGVFIAHHVHDPSQTILGFIEVEVSAKKIIAGLDRSRSQLIILSLLIALAASMIVYFSIRYLVGIPVKKLVNGTKRVAQGDFTHEIPSGKAELGVLADSFNKMQGQLFSTQSQLIESEKLASLGKIADEIANEISNPLTGIIIYSESLLSLGGPEDPGRRDHETILQEALKIRESVRNILSMAKKEKLNFVLVDIEALIDHAISIVRKLSNFRNVRILRTIPKDFPKAKADPGLLEQVFLNLLLVFSDGMQTGGILNISAAYSEKDRRIEIQFADRQGTIPESVAHALSELEFTSESRGTARTTISLSVCKDIMALHSGRIYIHSEAGTAPSIMLEIPA